jgi:hypothetical protein
MKFTIKGVRLAALLVPALALAAPALAQVRPPTLRDSQEPGSVIVFPKFIQGTVALPEGGTAPVTELEIGVVCPKGVICPEHEPVKIRFHWVCGTGEFNLAGSFICQETDFDVTATVWEKIVLVPDGSFTGVATKTVPAAPCFNGYLIGWVINPANDRPVKFDGLVGDAVLRETGPRSRVTLRSRSRQIPGWQLSPQRAAPLQPTVMVLFCLTAAPVITRRSPDRSLETSGIPTSRPARTSTIRYSPCSRLT